MKFSARVGKWLKISAITRDPYKCPFCGNSNDKPTFYCPNCGKRMIDKRGENK